MKLHNLKIKEEYASAKLRGDKLFEIRLNDRDFRVGDVVKYTCIDSSVVDEKISKKLYYITYITNFEQKDGYVVFGEDELVPVPNQEDFPFWKKTTNRYNAGALANVDAH